MRHRIKRLAFAAGVVLLATACTETSTAPEGTDQVVERAQVSANRDMQGGSSVAWNRTAQQLIADRLVTAVHLQSRILSYLSLAQYNAVAAAERANDRRHHASAAAASAGASVAVLTSFFPGDAAILEATLDAQFPADQHGGKRKQEDLARGEEIGRAVGAQVVAYAAADNFNVLIPPPAPIGPGYWTSSAVPPAPSVRSLYGTRPFFLRSGDQFRPPPPPAFGSPEFLAALAEIRTISDTRTAEQVAQAQLWAPRGPAYMNEIAVGLIESHGRNERRTAHILALANMTAFDALIGCWDAKFAYWFVRPTKADPAITLAIPLPNHPSYVSGHSCMMASYAAVLSHAFPRETARLDQMVTEAGLSRMYGGLHYRFDITGGQELGRRVGAWAIAHDVRWGRPFPLD
jgi:membrane-associated phospholipid phosphatase